MPVKIKHAVIFIATLFSACSQSSNNPDKAMVEIELPLGQMAVYANATYFVRNDSLILNALRMSSVLFSMQQQSNDTSYLSAVVAEYIPDDFTGHGSNQGTLQLSVTSDWISIQSKDNVSANFLFKSFADTTAVPTSDFLQDAIYPKVLVEGETHDIFRPASNLSSSIYKKFRIGRAINWDDAFGAANGIYLETQSTFANNDTLYTTAVYDAHGLIISQYSLDIIIFDGSGGTSDTLRSHYISRRINEYNNPLLTRELSFYANIVIQNELTPIY